MNEFFISQNTINFYNMLVQEVKPFDYALQGDVFDNDIL